MKIAYIVGLFPRLYNTFTLNDILRLIDTGHDVLIFAIGKTKETVVNEGVRRVKDKTYYFDDFVLAGRGNMSRWLINLARRRRVPNFLARAVGWLLFERQSNNKTETRYFPDFGLKVYGLTGIAEKIKAERVDIIHGAFGSREATAAMILSRLTGTPFTFEAHAKDLFVGFGHAHEKIAAASKIFTISDYNRHYLTQDLGCPKAKIIVKRVLFNKKHCDDISATPRGEDLIVSVCRLDPIKGLRYAIEALRILTKEWKTLEYAIIGDGPLRAELAAQARNLSLGSKVLFLGNLSNEEALSHIARATVAILPSTIAPNGDRDGIPTSLIEAMYLKTPVVASRVSGIPELIDDGVNGFLTEPGNVQQIAEKIAVLLSDKSLRLKMGEQARKKIQSEFNTEVNSSKLIAAWADIMARKSAA